MLANYTLPATLNLNNVMQCFKAIKALASQALSVEASQVEQIDAAGMALLLELQQQPNIKLQNLSPAICKVAALYQLEL